MASQPLTRVNRLHALQASIFLNSTYEAHYSFQKFTSFCIFNFKILQCCCCYKLKNIYIFFYFVLEYSRLQRRQWHPTPVLLPGKSHGRGSLVGCSPWGRWESGTTERLHCHFSLSSIGGGNGNPLQCSCLENPRDGGAWWAAVYGVAQSRTRLKRLSSSVAC